MNISHIDQFVDNGINGQTADGMDIEFSGDVLRCVSTVLTLMKRFSAISLFVMPRTIQPTISRSRSESISCCATDVVSFLTCLLPRQPWPPATAQREQKFILHLTMLVQIGFTIEYVKEHIIQQVNRVCQRVIFDNNIFQLLQFLSMPL